MKEYTIGTVISGGWTITEEIGSGANGTVYKIEKHIGPVTTVSALKVIRIPQSQNAIKQAYSEGMDEISITSYFQGFVDEILKEVALMNQLKDHPNIVGYEDSEIIKHEEGIGWDILIRMELLTPLDTYLLHHNMDEKEAIQMGLDLTNALDYCHKKGIIHRDIKPANIFVTETGTFKLGDFGIARTMEKTTGGLSKKGTESYMAPEVYLVRPYNESVDQYSLGMVLYSCMNNNRLPFLPPYPQPITFSDREEALARRMRGEELPKPSEASDAFSKVISRACNYNPKRRYTDSAEFHNALDALIPKKLEETPPPVPKKKFDFKSIPVWAWCVAACVVCILGFFAIRAFQKPNTITPDPSAETVVEENVQQEIESIEEPVKTDKYYQKEFETVIEPLLEKMCYVDGVNWETASMEEIGKSLEGDFVFYAGGNNYSETYSFTTSSDSKCRYMNAQDSDEDVHINGREMDFDLKDQWVMVEMEWWVSWDHSDESLNIINNHFPDAGFKMYDQEEDVLEVIGVSDDMLEWADNFGEDGIDWWDDDHEIMTSVTIHQYDDSYAIFFWRNSRSVWMEFRSSGELRKVNVGYDYQTTRRGS